MTDVTQEEAATGATQLLIRAEQLASEHITAGELRKAELVAEGEAFLADAEARKDELIAEAEEQASLLVERAELDAEELTTKVAGLRELEADYRSKLREYLEGALERLDQEPDLEA